MIQPLFAAPGTPELILILVIVVLVFGAAKLPDLARSTGQALKIFKSETKGLIDGDEKSTKVDGAEAPSDQTTPAAAPARELPPVGQDGTAPTTAPGTEASTDRQQG